MTDVIYALKARTGGNVVDVDYALTQVNEMVNKKGLSTIETDAVAKIVLAIVSCLCEGLTRPCKLEHVRLSCIFLYVIGI